MDAMLFEPVQLRGVQVRNRVVLSPMLQYAAQNGHVNDWHLAHLAKFAVGGVGLVFMESTKVEARGCSTPNDPGLWKDEFIAPLQRITSFIKAYGATPGIQLGHSGRKGRRAVPWEGRTPSHFPGVDHGEEWELIGPSAIAHGNGYAVPRQMTHADIQEVLNNWEQAARRANEAGFDVLEIHGAHGYLIHQFLSAAANQRDDEYGGSLEKRMRFAIEVTDRVRRAWPEDKPLFFRVSAVDEAGLGIEDSIALAIALRRHGVDVIDCSSGGMSGAIVTDARPSYGYQVEYARRIREAADIKTMAVGLIVHADHAEEILRTSSADLVALGRELLFNPNWALDAAQKLGIASPFKLVPPAYAYWLEKRSKIGFGNPSTWQRGLQA